MIKEQKDYIKHRRLEKQTVELHTESTFDEGKRKGVVSFEEGEMHFCENVEHRGPRSKQIARTAHFSVNERPDGRIAGTFHFDPSTKNIKGKLSAEFWQALSIALNLKVEGGGDE